MECRARVLVLDPVDSVFKEMLSKCCVCVDEEHSLPREKLLELVKEYDVVVVRSRTRIDRDVLFRGAEGKLKIVARAGVGIDNIDAETAQKLGIKVLNVPHGATQSVAELTIGLMIAIARRIAELDRAVKEGRWCKVHGIELYGKTLLIVGFGRIGRRVAEIARAIGMKVVVYDKPEVLDYAWTLGFETVEDLCEGLRRADVVSLHVPLTPETRYMINRATIYGCLKPGAIIVNTSRGAVIDTEAVLEALEKGVVGGLAIDVLEHEPPQTDIEMKLIRHPRVVVTPHIGAQTFEAQYRIACELARGILAHLGIGCEI